MINRQANPINGNQRPTRLVHPETDRTHRADNG